MLPVQENRTLPYRVDQSCRSRPQESRYSVPRGRSAENDKKSYRLGKTTMHLRDYQEEGSEAALVKSTNAKAGI